MKVKKDCFGHIVAYPWGEDHLARVEYCPNDHEVATNIEIHKARSPEEAIERLETVIEAIRIVTNKGKRKQQRKGEG